MHTDPSTPTSRREAVRRARDAFPPMGVYAIRNRADGSVRVKSSRQVPGAINRLRFELARGTHPDKRLQAEWQALGAEAFAFEVLELVRERADEGFDYAAELALLERLYRDELERGPGG